jgi:hypothetical protein
MLPEFFFVNGAHFLGFYVVASVKSRTAEYRPTGLASVA